MPTGLVLLSLLLTTAVASAQPTIARVQPAPVRSASTCGWSFFTPSARPPALEEHAGRAGIGANDVAAALALLERWYRACDEKAAREGVRLLAGVVREMGWPEVALELAETATPPRDPLGVSANIYAFRGERETELVAYVFVPAGELRSTRSADGHAMYALEALFAPGDPVSQRVVRADTTIVFTSPRPLPKDATVGTAVALEMPPMELARLTVGVTNRNDRGQG